jgi:hypothetical protein
VDFGKPIRLTLRNGAALVGEPLTQYDQSFGTTPDPPLRFSRADDIAILTKGLDATDCINWILVELKMFL